MKKILSLIGLCGLFAALYAYTDIDNATLYSWIHGHGPWTFVLIDVRSSSELDATGIIGTDSCRPYNISYSTNFAQQCAAIAKDSVIVLYCQSGSRATLAAQACENAGYKNVHRHSVGMNNWTYPTISGTFLKLISLLPEPSMRPIPPVATQRNFALVNVPKTSQVVTRINFKRMYAPALNCAGRRGVSCASGYTLVEHKYFNTFYLR